MEAGGWSGNGVPGQGNSMGYAEEGHRTLKQQKKARDGLDIALKLSKVLPQR